MILKHDQCSNGTHVVDGLFGPGFASSDHHQTAPSLSHDDSQMQSKFAQSCPKNFDQWKTHKVNTYDVHFKAHVYKRFAHKNTLQVAIPPPRHLSSGDAGRGAGNIPHTKDRAKEGIYQHSTAFLLT